MRATGHPTLLPPTRKRSSRRIERHTADLGERIGRLDESAWENKARFLVHGNLAWEAPLGDMLWFMFFDSIHHRGQLSTYIRPMGGKVPSIYGPSGDNSTA